MGDTYRAIVVRETGGGFSQAIEELDSDDLPEGEVVVRVLYSSLNYKDALSASGNRGVTKQYPHTPGIDAAGEVVSSTVADFQPGDLVTVTDYDLGMNTPGGWGERIRVPADWVVPVPEGLGAEESMAIGTAGLTAAMSVLEVTNASITPDRGPVLVTGATGGVGSFAVSILAHAGYDVVAATGKPDARPFLLGLGATDVLSRDEIDPDPSRPLVKGRWAAVVDTVGGPILAAAVKSVMARGVVTCCGNVAAPELHTTVYPFILRGLRLIGVDCGNCPIESRHDLWTMLAGGWKIDGLSELYRVVRLESVEEEVEAMLQGKSRGRVVVAVSGDR